MKYGRESKKTGIGLSRDVYADQFAEPGDIRTNYMVTLHGDVLHENENPQELAKTLMEMSESLYHVADFLRRKGSKRSTSEEPTGDL